MRLRAIHRVGIACLLVAVAARFVGAVEQAVGGAVVDPAEAELKELGSQYKRLENEWLVSSPPDGLVEIDKEMSDEEWLRIGREKEAKLPGPDEQLLPRFLALAEKYPDSPFALDALAFVIRRGGPQTGDVQGEPWRIKERAIDLVSEHHMADPRVVHVLDSLGGSLPSQKTEAFLRRAFESGSDRSTRAAAGLSLARYLHHLGNVHDLSQRLKSKPKLLNYQRFWKLVVTPYVEENFPYDDAQVSAEVEQVLRQVQENYADVEAADLTFSGPSNVFVRTVPYSHRKTYGDMAKLLLFERNSLAPGKQAPDIEGVDADGKKFRLSDYQGKVVLLTFSANWCGVCVELYPLERNLVDKFRDEPFVLLSVSRDESVDTLKSSLASGEITWRCWWDGMEGPIRESWNSPGAPKIYLLDQRRVIQDVRLNRTSTPEEFEDAITAVLKKIPASDRPSQ